ncbi:hypothetical protein DRH14_02395 [Candidatus Shapirobacteria bacterium]|nr:MAG: hypothetical protein DRH14_02395 [Candidatus Shapirobacteria bacterium]
MKNGLAVALVTGQDYFVAKRLVRELLEKDLVVVIVGETLDDSFKRGGNLELVANLVDFKEKIEYVFSFDEKNEVLDRAEADNSKLVVVRVNKDCEEEKLKRVLSKRDLNWRLVCLKNVYGEGVDLAEIDMGKVVWRAVKNMKLEFLFEMVDCLEVSDAVEVLLRSCFLSGTEKEVFRISGDVVKAEIMAKILIKEAKMTIYDYEIKNKKEEKKWSGVEVKESADKLRWKPVVSFEEGVKDFLQYVFGIVDEELRRKRREEDRKLEIETRERRSQAKTGFYQVEVIDDGVDSLKKEEKVEVITKEREKREESWRNFKIKGSALRRVEEVVEIFGEDKKKEEKPEKKIVADKNRKKSGEEKKINWKTWLAVVFLGLIIPCLLFGSWWSFRLYKTAKSLLVVETLVKESKWVEAGKEVDKALEEVDKLDFNRKGWEKYHLGIKLLKSGLNLEKELVFLARNGEEMMLSIFGKKDIDWLISLDKMEKSFNRVEGEVGLLEARLKGGVVWLPPRWRNKVKKVTDELKKTRNLISKLEGFIPILGDFLGVDGKRRDYLVLFQNEMELRATGGFIGSYGVLSFQDGRLLNLEVKDIYGIDGQLKGYVEAPREMREIMGESRWYMRDANWQADFRASAKDLRWFFKKEANRDVDGVIGINLAVAKSLLSVTGEVYIPDFKENVNADNLYDEAEFYSESNSFAGSVQKEKFLALLAKVLLEKLKELNGDQELKLVESLIDSLESNEIQIAVDDKKIMAKIGDLGWDGAIYNGGCAKDNCLADYLFVVESNLGVNKANYFLYRNMDQVVDIGKKEIKRKIKIYYENTAKSSAWPGGDYKNYIRIYLPKDVEISEVVAYDGDDSNTRKIFKKEELNIRDKNNKKEIGFLLVVPIGKKRVVELNYFSKIDLEKEKDFSYLSYVQKQSGYGDTSFVSLISFPDGWQPMQVQPAGTLVEEKLLFNQKLKKDLKMGVELSR